MINSLIFSINENILAKIFNQTRQCYSKKDYLRLFYKFCQKTNSEYQNNLFKWMKEKFTEVNFENCNLKNLVYIYTYKNKIVYVGKSRMKYSDRFDLSYDNSLFGEFSSKVNFNAKNKDWKFFVYQSDEYSIEDIESYLINWFAINEIPTLNSQCEDIPQLLSKKLKLKKKFKKVNI